MGSAPSKKSATAGSPALFDYKDWVRLQPDIPADALILEKPESDTVERIEEARRQKVEAIVTGFLPDEIDWPTPGWSETLGYFVERFTFRPFVLTMVESEPTEAKHVLGIGDRADTTIDALTAACADAAGKSAVNLLLADTGSKRLVDMIAHALLVINASTSWAVGFAVDELAVRLGVPIVRLFNPGFSPLRFAFLQMEPPSPGIQQIVRLRPLLAGQMQERKRRTVRSGFQRAIDDGVFGRELFGHDAFTRVWPESPVAQRQPDESPLLSSWVYRTISWSALAAFVQLVGVSAEQLAVLDRIVAEWILAAQGEKPERSRLSRAVGRWTRFRPRWIEVYSDLAGHGTEAAHAVRSWIRHAAAIQSEQAPLFPLIDAARWALEKQEGGDAASAWLVAWGTALQNIEQLIHQETSLQPEMRSLCVKVCWDRVQATCAVLPRTREDESTLRRLLAREDVWRVSFGNAGPFLRFLIAARLRSLPMAVVAWRAVVAETGIPSRGGWAQLARNAFSAENLFLAWLSRVAACPDKLSRVTDIGRLLEFWYVRRAAKLWQRCRPPRIESELAYAFNALRSFSASYERDPPVALFVPALKGDPVTTLRAVREMERVDAKRASLLGLSAGLAIWLQGNIVGVRAILAHFDSDKAPVDDAYQCFLFALLTQLAGDPNRSESALQRLRSIAPTFFTENATDPRWIWVGVVFKIAGRESDAEHMCALAASRSPATNRAFYDDMMAGSESIAPSWGEFLNA